MARPEWLARMSQTLELSDGLELFFVIGPALRARPLLELIEAELGGRSQTCWHRLHVEGVDRVLDGEPTVRTVRLIHGLERMSSKAARRLVEELNVNRDALERDAFVFFIPDDFIDSFTRSAVDLLAWRSLMVRVHDDDFELDDEREIIETLLIRAWLAGTYEPLRDVEVEQGARVPLLDWIDGSAVQQLSVGEPNQAGLDARFASRLVARGLAVRVELQQSRVVPMDVGDYEYWVPAATSLDAAIRALGLPHRLQRCFEQLWIDGRVFALCGQGRGTSAPARLEYRWGERLPRLAPLSDEQLRHMVTKKIAFATAWDDAWSGFVDALVVATRDEPPWRSAWFIDGFVDNVLLGPRGGPDPGRLPEVLSQEERWLRRMWNPKLRPAD